ncbi:MAG: class I SAM-dependent rRNA methyltransferase [Fimbriimonadales bacterium]
MLEGRVVLKPGREKKLRHLYPWVQQGEIAEVQGSPTAGALVQVLAHDGNMMGVGTYNPKPRFPVRMLTLQDEPITTAFFAHRLERALRLRQKAVSDTNATRVLFGESDGVPGLIVDQFGDYLVVQVRTAGMERLKPLWLPALVEVLKPQGILERSEMESRREEGLRPHTEMLYGEVPEYLAIHESGLEFLVPTQWGLKTGFYIDQRENRRQLARQLTPGERVLDLFCYTGAFSLYAARVGAQATGIDILPDAIALAQRHAQMNQLEATWHTANAFDWLVEAQARGEQYEWIVLDPPAIAKTRGQRDSLKWAVWKLVYNALPLLPEGGHLVVCSCAYQLDLSIMIDTVRLACTDRGRALWVDDVSFQSPDHPFLLQFPESLYLKCLWLRVG